MSESIILQAWWYPWKVTTEVCRIVILPYVVFNFFLSGVRYNWNWRIYGLPVIQRTRGSSIKLGEYLELRSFTQSNPIGINHPVFISTRSSFSRIHIKDYFQMSGGAIISTKSIEIGNHVMVGANSIIVDSNFHSMEISSKGKREDDNDPLPVIIEDDVFIGMSAIILKGTTIGKGSVVGAGSVVKGVFPPYSVIAGNPAKVIRTLLQ